MSQTYNPSHAPQYGERMNAATGNTYPDRDGSAIDLRAVFAGMWQRKLLMLTIISVIMLTAVAFAFTATPKFTSTAKILIGGPATSYRDPDLGNTSRQQSRADGQQEVYSQVEVIQSRDLAKRVAATLKLDQRSEFFSSAKSSPIK